METVGSLGSFTILTNHIPDTDTLEEVEDLALSKLAASEIDVPNQTLHRG